MLFSSKLLALPWQLDKSILALPKRSHRFHVPWLPHHKKTYMRAHLWRLHKPKLKSYKQEKSVPHFLQWNNCHTSHYTGQPIHAEALLNSEYFQNFWFKPSENVGLRSQGGRSVTQMLIRHFLPWHKGKGRLLQDFQCCMTRASILWLKAEKK